MLHLVVHHDNDPHKPYKNVWIDDNRVKTITTTQEVGRLCEMAARRGERVRFHRCRHGAFEPLICAEARVASVQFVDRKMWLVHFDEHTVLQVAPRVTPPQGTNYY